MDAGSFVGQPFLTPLLPGQFLADEKSKCARVPLNGFPLLATL